jgi:hypothetical protein
MAGLVSAMPEDPTKRAVGFSLMEIAGWYDDRAPEQLSTPTRLTIEEPGPIRFRRRGILLGQGSGPGVATVTHLESDGEPVLAAANMSSGNVHLFTLSGGPRAIGRAGHPARVVSGDVDGDGRSDLIISDLGEPMPTDKPVGRVIVGLAAPDGSYAFEVVLEGVGRVADARAFDVDGDGDLDIAVAAFGWLRRGGIYILYNESEPGGPLAFRAEQVLARAGAVSLVPLPASKHGSDVGFAVAFAQHHELVSVFYSRKGDATQTGFEEKVLYRAPHPNWGISNLISADLDGDSDIDFVLSHGDTLDDGLPLKPYHGVQWLENDGGSFRAHTIGALYGAHGAAVADLDGDGDLDVAAASFLPQIQLPVSAEGGRVDSVVWFERTHDGWIPHGIERAHPRHTGLTVADLNRDGRPDVVTTINFAWDIETQESGPSLEAWINLGPRPGTNQVQP